MENSLARNFKKASIHFSIAAMFLCISSPGTCSQSQDSGSLCFQFEVPVDQSKFPEIPLELLSNHFTVFVTYPGARAVGEIAIKNQTKRSLKSILAIVSYTNQKGELIFSVPYFARLAHASGPPGNVRTFLENRLRTPLEPGGMITMSGTTLLVFQERNLLAKLAEVILEDDEGTTVVSIGNWKLAPFPIRFPDDFSPHLTSAKRQSQDFIIAALHIDETGDVRKVEFKSQITIAKTVQETIEAKLRQIKFYPGTEGGISINYQLQLRIRFLEEMAAHSRSCGFDGAPSQFATFDFVQGNFGQQKLKWEAFFGGIPARGTVRSGIVSREK